MTIGMLEALSGAIGEADNAIAGLVQTRLTAAVNPTTALSATFVWNGTTIITTTDTSEVEVGDWIRLDADGQLFQIVDEIPNTSVEIDNPIGYPIPSGSTQSSKATRVLPVESVLNWGGEGKIGIGGVVYRYASRTDTSLEGITHVKGGVLTAGLKISHPIESTVIDLSQSQSAIDLVRRAMLVDYAEGEDLNAIGRNLGVNRLPFLGEDDTFRDIVKALAYNPRGTIFGLELALAALVGEGNFEIYEDLINFPCTVFIRLLGAAVTSDTSAGKTYLTGPELQPPTSDTTFAIDHSIVDRGSMGSVLWKDENVLTDCRVIFPSAHLIEEYDGDTPHSAWVVSGTGITEGVDIIQTGAEVEFTNPAPTDTSLYRRTLRLQEESEGYFGALVTVPTGAAVDPAIVTGLLVDDGVQTCNVGIQADTAGTFKVGIVTGGAFITGGTQFTRDTYHEIVLRKQGNSPWELYIDGNLVETVAYSGSLPSFGFHHMILGHFATAASSNKLRVKQLAVWVHTSVDFWPARNQGSVAAANPQRIDVGSAFLISGDVGNTFIVSGSGATNGQGGNNNGRYFVDSLVSAQVAELRGRVEEGAEVQTATRIAVPTDGPQFQFPDDLGKEIVLSGSALANDGPYIIDKLLQPGTLTDYQTFATPVPEKTNICEIVGGGLTPETDLDWQLNPQFVNESPVDWELSDAGSVTGTTATLRQALPLSASDCYRVLTVIYSTVLSAQLLRNALVNNYVVAEFPDLLFGYYPFYIADPLGFVRTYLDAITAAGVIPDFLVE